ncbi:MAG: hypothetical protein A2V83_11630 [Nitrospirae bacterium RBG_16_64_22]|nr:MAG: hypothetical protein A2V83_11630 [Nitrospirae bacterium RBG_16_64_22]
MTGLRLLALLILVLLPLTDASASSQPSPKKKLGEIQKQIREETQKVREAARQERSVMAQMDEIDRDLNEKEKELFSIRRRMEESRREYNRLKQEQSGFERKLSEQKKLLSARLRSIYKSNRQGAAQAFFSAPHVQAGMRRLNYLARIADQDRQSIVTYQTMLSRLVVKSEEIEAKRRDLQVLEADVEKAKGAVAGERTRKNALLAQIRKEKKIGEEVILGLREAAQRLKTLMTELPKKRELQPHRGSGFAREKGRLPWPARGKVVGPFGPYKDPELGATFTRNGVEIESTAGTEIKSVHEGVVIFADWFKGFGNLIVLSHGDHYYSLYARLAEIMTAVGQRVSRGHPIGRSGEGGSPRGSLFYFEIRDRTEPLDPLQWLKKTR